MWERLNYEPEYIYHFTKKYKVESIKKDRQLKKFKDIYIFACESYEDCIVVIQNTLLNPNAKFIDFDGIAKKYNNVNIEEYVILKLKPRYSNILLWYKSQSAKNSVIDNITIAYKGNLPITFIEEMKIKLT